MASELDALALYHRVSQFIYREARLLDERKWAEWEALFLEDGEYWAPASQDQPDAKNFVSLIYETSLLRQVRLARYASPAAFSLQPFPRSSHFVSNVMIDEASAGEVKATSRFLMTEFRRDAPVYFAGEYVHRLVAVDGDYRIRLKKATLVNCDGALPSSSIYF